jgi:predicted nucleotidyltransferase
MSDTVSYINEIVPRAAILELSEKIAREFNPERIILFGSYAYGDPTPDSDVDLLVVMPFEGHGWEMATQILNRAEPRFPLDLLARTPAQLRERIQLGDIFIAEIWSQGEVLYEARGDQ